MRNLRNKTAGISLVALVVTIIVLIILTAAVIVTFMEGGIVDKAKEAVFKSDIRTYQEILAIKNAENQIKIATGNGEGEGLNSTEVKDIIPEFKEEYAGLIQIVNGEIVLGETEKELYTDWLKELGIGSGESAVAVLSVGDYVNYSLPLEEGTDYIIPNEYYYVCTDSFFAPAEKIEYKPINWRVLKNDGDNITLISEEPIEYLYYGTLVSGEYIAEALDAICGGLYNREGIGTSRNLNVDDVNSIIGYTGDVAEEFYKGNIDENTEEYKLIFRNSANTDNLSYLLSSSLVMYHLCFDDPEDEYDEYSECDAIKQIYSGGVGYDIVVCPHDDCTEGPMRPIVILNSDVQFKPASTQINGKPTWDIVE